MFAAMPLAPAGASPSPAPVKYYIVGNGPAESLFTIAAKTLGDGNEWAEIFRLNEGRLEPDGERFTNPRVIRPGWILQLPADATGPGVRVGPLPAVTPSPSASLRTSPSAAPRRPSVVMIGGAALLSSLTAVLALGLIRRRAYHGHHRRATVIQPHHLQLLPAVVEPAAKPAGRSRQFVAMRLVVLAMAVPIIFGVLAATTELALHGYGFFVFRSAGTGATSSNPLPSPSPTHHQH
jgi:hypothetical protein